MGENVFFEIFLAFGCGESGWGGSWGVVFGEITGSVFLEEENGVD